MESKTPGLPWPSVECHIGVAQVFGSRLELKPRNLPCLFSVYTRCQAGQFVLLPFSAAPLYNGRGISDAR